MGHSLYPDPLPERVQVLKHFLQLIGGMLKQPPGKTGSRQLVAYFVIRRMGIGSQVYEELVLHVGLDGYVVYEKVFVLPEMRPDMRQILAEREDNSAQMAFAMAELAQTTARDMMLLGLLPAEKLSKEHEEQMPTGRKRLLPPQVPTMLILTK